MQISTEKISKGLATLILSSFSDWVRCLSSTWSTLRIIWRRLQKHLIYTTSNLTRRHHASEMRLKSNRLRTQFWRRNFDLSKKRFQPTNIYLNCQQSKDLSSTSANNAPSFSFQKSIFKSTMVDLIQRTTFTATIRLRLISRDTPIPTSSTHSKTPTKILAVKLPLVI